MTRAEVNGKFVIVDDSKINIKSPETDADPALAVLFGSTLIDFEAEMDARNQWASVEARSWDYAGQDIFEHVTDSVPINEPGNVSGQTLSESLSPKKIELRHSAQAIEEELQEWKLYEVALSCLSNFTIFGLCFFLIPGIQMGLS